jgi:hypothetical protein
MQPATFLIGRKEGAVKSLPRQIEKIIEPEPVTEGAGVRLKRSIGTERLDYVDPFLLLDHFASNDPRDYERPDSRCIPIEGSKR